MPLPTSVFNDMTSYLAGCAADASTFIMVLPKATQLRQIDMPSVTEFPTATLHRDACGKAQQQRTAEEKAVVCDDAKRLGIKATCSPTLSFVTLNSTPDKLASFLNNENIVMAWPPHALAP